MYKVIALCDTFFKIFCIFITISMIKVNKKKVTKKYAREKVFN